jgi:hypothetical protein
VVLIVAPLSGHYATLLRDTVRTMLKDHKVYITDWKNARLVPLSEGEFHLDDYVNYVQEFIRYLQATYGNCHVMSVCQPTVPVLAAVSLMASRGETTPLSMTMMGGPIDARKSPTAVNNLAVQRSHELVREQRDLPRADNFPGAGRRVYPGFLQHTGFMAMNPDRHATSHYDYFQDLIKGDNESAESHRKFYDEYNAVLDMDADYYLETINRCSRSSSWSTAPGTCATKGKSRTRAPPGHPGCRPADRRRRTGRHFGLGPDRRRPRPVHRHRKPRPDALRGQGRRPLRHLQRPPLARNGVPGGQDLHPGHQHQRPPRPPVAAAQAAESAPKPAKRPAGRETHGRKARPPRSDCLRRHAARASPL